MRKILLVFISILLTSCETIQSTLDCGDIFRVQHCILLKPIVEHRKQEMRNYKNQKLIERVQLETYSPPKLENPKRTWGEK